MSNKIKPKPLSGPWSIWRHGDYIAVQAKDPLEVCRITRFSNPMWHEGNAKLIAAAPELFSACKAALEIMELDGMINTSGVVCTDVLNRMMAAIAKAEGR